MTTATRRSIRSLLLSTLCTSSLFSYVHAHMELENPMPWDSPQSANSADRDYDIKSPLMGDGSDFPCKGLDQASAGLSATTNYKAGQTYSMTVTGYANHNGGSCQISLSYDKGKTWKVIKSLIGACPGKGGGSYDFTIPTAAPSGTALFAWTWINHTGNREFYMNCAVVDIQGQSGGDLCALPNMYVANLGGVNSCISPEGIDTMYPHPGTDVVYGDGMSASSPSTGSSACEIPAPQCGNSNSPDNSQPQSSQSRPQSSQSTPQSSQSRPQSSQSTPQSSQQSTPKSSQSTPQSSQSTPKSSQSTPKSSQSTPQNSQSTPHYSQTRPKDFQPMPQYPRPRSSYTSHAASSPRSSPRPASRSASRLRGSAINAPEIAVSSSFPTTPGALWGTATPTPGAGNTTPTFRVTSTTTSTPDATDSSLIDPYIKALLTATPSPSENANASTGNRTTPFNLPSDLLKLFSPPGGVQQGGHNSASLAEAETSATTAAICSSSCPPRPVVTQYSQAPPPPASCVSPVLACDCSASGDYCAPVNDCTTRCVGSSTGTESSTWRTVVVNSADTTVTGTFSPSSRSSFSPSPTSSSLSPSTSGEHPPYITTDPNTADYLPCNPGNFLCSSASDFYTCNQPAPPALVSAGLATNGWAWGWSRPVAPGMLCLPFERVSNGTEPGSHKGVVRDDRYVRARPNGSCAEAQEGKARCAEEGKAFEVCDNGGWVAMGDVVQGTWCEGDGQIVRKIA